MSEFRRYGPLVTPADARRATVLAWLPAAWLCASCLFSAALTLSLDRIPGNVGTVERQSALAAALAFLALAGFAAWLCATVRRRAPRWACGVILIWLVGEILAKLLDGHLIATIVDLVMLWFAAGALRGAIVLARLEAGWATPRTERE